MANVLITKNSSSAANVPTAGEMVEGELAINTADKKLYSKTASAVFQVFDGVYATDAHIHDTFDRASSVLSGANVFSNIVVTDGITTALATRAMSITDLGGPYTNNAGTVTNVNDGNGMTFTAISGTGDVTMGTPGTLTGSTSNGVTTNSHTHAITTSGSGAIMAVNGATLTGQMNCADQQLNRPVLEDYGVKHTAPTVSGNAVTVNCVNGNSFAIDMDPATAAVAVTLSNPSASGTYCEVQLHIIMGTPAWGITWPGSVTWQGGSAPTLTVTNNLVDLVHLYTIDAGTNWYGTFAGADAVAGGGTVTSVASGVGMSFSTITGTGTVTMGTPTTLTAATTNTATGTTHQHAITGFSETSHTHTFDSLTSKTSGTGNYTTTGDMTADNFEATGLGPSTNAGTDDLYIGGYGIIGSRVASVYVSNFAGPVSLNYAGNHGNSVKLATNNTGVTVTGTMAATTVTGANVSTGADPGHTHTTASITGLSGSNTGDNAGVTSVGVTSPIASTGGTSPTISHVATAGNKHIPTGGAANNFLQYSASGTAVWSAVTTGEVSGYQTPAMYSSGGLPVLNTGITAAEYRTAIGAGTSSTTGTVTAVNNGNGMNFTNISTSGTVTMGTPGSITDTSTNAVQTSSHTHAVSHTGTGSFAMAAGPTFTGTVAVATLTASGNINANGNIVGDGATTITGIEQIVVDGTADIRKTSHGCYLYHQSASYDNDQNGGITFSTAAASGGTTGDIWFRYTA